LDLRPYQEQCIKNIRDNFDNGIERLLAVLATGCGKTVIATEIPKWFPMKQNFFIVHTDELAKQARDKMRDAHPDLEVGIEMGDLYAVRQCDIIVASVQTLGRQGSSRIGSFDPRRVGSIQIDEAHHATADGYGRILSHFGFTGDSQRTGILVVGYTATPNRSDGVGLARVFDKIAYNYGMLEAIRDGWLVNLRGLRVRTQASLDSVSTAAGEFNTTELSRVVNTPYRNDLIVQEWIKSAENRKTIGFTVDIQHAKDLAAAFNRAGVAADAVWGDDHERTSKLERHKAGLVKVLLNANVLTEGYDDPSVSCILLAAPTKSALRYIQRVGRGTRLYPGKIDCLVLDFTDATTKHSLATLPSIFGLPKNLNLKGMPITDAVDAIDSVMRGSPTLNLSGLEDLDNLQTYAEQVNLLEVKYAPEVEANSKYQWHKDSDGNYVLLLPKAESITIRGDLLGQYRVSGTVNGAQFDEAERTLEAAFGTADNMLRYLGRNLMQFVRRETSSKGREPITPRQAAAIRDIFRIQKTQCPDLSKWTKHQASQLIRKFNVS
jgi:superfamily II DNA or RNA helicase